MLNTNAIYQAIHPKTAAALTTLEILPTVDSTNAYLIAHANARSGHVCLAEEQTAGRGQHGKTWISPPTSNIYLSLLWEFSHSQQALSGLSLAIGIAVVKALRNFGIANIGLKWPNDIWYFHRKLAGILIETTRMQNTTSAIVGIGLNVNMTETMLVPIDQPWIDIKTITGKPADRNLIAVLLLDELLETLSRFGNSGFSAFLDEWHQFDILLNQTIIIDCHTDEIHGIAKGVDHHGNLVLQCGNKLRTFTTGETRIRRTR